jgi:hypothetical protein
MPGNVVVIIIQDTKLVGTREFLFVSCLQLLCLAAACSYGQASFETAIPATKKCHIEIVIYIHMPSFKILYSLYRIVVGACLASG